MIRVFASRFNLEPHETHSVDREWTIEGWLCANVHTYDPAAVPQFSATLNGALIPTGDWPTQRFSPKDTLDLAVEPKGTELFFGGLFLVATRTLAPKIPKVSSASNTPGKDINEASIKGNKVKLNDPIPDQAGFRKVYPSYLSPPRRYFAGPRDQRMDVCLCVGVGDLQIDSERVLIGDTPLISLGADADYAFYGPGESLANDPRSWWWNDVTEVGSSSNGASGLELTVSTLLTESYVASVHQFSGKNISIPNGSGAFPSDWSAGLIIRVEAPYTYEFIDGGAGADIVRGTNLGMLNPSVGQQIEIAGINEGLYTIASYSPASAAIPGTPSTLTGSAAPSRFDFSTNNLTFSVARGTSSYSVTLTTNTTNLAGLVTAINAQLGGAAVRASASGPFLRFTEQTPYAGQAITSGNAAVVLGSAPTSVTGAAATGEKQPEITLSFDNGVPATQLTLGSISTTIGQRGLRYRVTTFSTSQLTVDRLRADGSTDTTWPGFTYYQTANAAISLDQASRDGGYRGPFVMCPEGEKTTTLEIDVFCPSGLLGIGKKNGFEYPVRTFYQFEYRDFDVAGPWTVIELEHQAASRDAVGYTTRIELPYAMRAEGRMKKRFVAQAAYESEVNNNTVWYGARSLLPSKTSYEGATVGTFTVRGGDRLSASSEQQVSVQATRILPVRREGAWQAPEPTRSIAAYALYLLKQVGYTDDDLDLAEWDRLGALWDARGDYYDNVHSTASTVQSILEDCLAAGFAEITVRRGLLRPVRDEPQDTFASLYTPASMTEDGMLDQQFDAIQPGDYDGVDVEYTDSRTWQVATVRCDLPGDARQRVMKIQANGVISRDKAYQIGMRQRRALKYRRKTFDWSTEMAAFNSNYLDFVQVAGDVPGYAQVALLKGYDSANRLIAVGEVFDWSVGVPPFQVSLRRPDGTNSGPYVVTRVDDYRLQLDRELDFPVIVDGSIEPPHVLFGIGWPVQITEIDPEGTRACRVQARIYDGRVYADDDTPATN